MGVCQYWVEWLCARYKALWYIGNHSGYQDIHLMVRYCNISVVRYVGLSYNTTSLGKRTVQWQGVGIGNAYIRYRYQNPFG